MDIGLDIGFATLGFHDRLIVLAGALGIEAFIAYPDALYARIGHPVTWIGALIGAADRHLNRARWGDHARRIMGVVTLLVLLALAVVLGWAIEAALPHGPPALRALALVAFAILAATLLAARSLHDHVAAVASALEGSGLAAGRSAVALIVGRDVAVLDAAGIARAAIESLSENFSDGVVAPAFWFGCLGFPGLIAYKAVNTADSMIGHKSDRHHAFGWAAARFDDLLNLPASRLTAVLVIVTAALSEGLLAATRAAAITWRDAPRHRSPNAGWPEAAFAGVLSLALAGPRVYGGSPVDDAVMGDGRRNATASDIRRGLRLYRMAAGLGFIMLLGGIFAAGRV